MMKKYLLLAFILFYFLIPSAVYAQSPNNKFGVHILFPVELEEAAQLVNSNGGDWGYVTIPIQANDKDLEKWQKFMDDAKRLHLIPIIRLATNGDYFNTKVWEKPKDENILDFANFLNSLEWPIKERYVIVFNEVNRGDEWGGQPNPAEYANILSYAVTTFKSKNPDFYIISSGMDNAAADSSESMNQYNYMRQMNQAVPGIFNQIDALSSHSYPNPGFRQPPQVITGQSVHSFKYEKELAYSLCGKDLPVFITETGWSANELPDSLISQYLKTAFESVWSDPSIVVVTPFLLKAGSEPFKQFSLINTEGPKHMRYQTIFDYPKVKGEPIISEIKKILGSQLPVSGNSFKKFNEDKNTENKSYKEAYMAIYNWLLKL